MRGVPNPVVLTGGYMGVFFMCLLGRWCPFFRAQIVSTCLLYGPLPKFAMSAGVKVCPNTSGPLDFEHSRGIFFQWAAFTRCFRALDVRPSYSVVYWLARCPPCHDLVTTSSTNRCRDVPKDIVFTLRASGLSDCICAFVVLSVPGRVAIVSIFTDRHCEGLQHLWPSARTDSPARDGARSGRMHASNTISLYTTPSRQFSRLPFAPWRPPLNNALKPLRRTIGSRTLFGRQRRPLREDICFCRWRCLTLLLAFGLSV